MNNKISKLKTHLLNFDFFRSAWSIYRKKQLHEEYISRRENFNDLSRKIGVSYEEGKVVESIRSRIQKRGYQPIIKNSGDIHTFACIPQYSWHKHLLPDLRELGRLSLFDYCEFGYRSDEFIFNGATGYRRREEMVSLMFETFKKTHAIDPVDWIFCYGGGQEFSSSVIRRITEEFGVPVVNMTFDDKHGWAGPSIGEHRTGAADITAEFDLFATSARVACEWHLIAGGRPIYMPEGVDIHHFSPGKTSINQEVAFVGAAYGFRPDVIKGLKRFNIPIQAYGKGWPNSDWVEDIVQIFRGSKINLGMGGIGYSDSLTNVKGRDFEIPAVGSGVYITSFNPDLAQHFNIGQEIICYRNFEEMVELVRHYLRNPEEAHSVAMRGRERCLKEHRWLHRYQKMLSIIGVLETKGIFNATTF